MLIRIVKDWHYPENFFRQIPEGNNVWAGITFTEERVDQCDYLIVLQRPPYDIQVRCPEGNAWLITQEPPVDYFNFHKKAFPYFDKVFTYYKEVNHPYYQSMQPVLPWHVNKTYDELSAVTQKNLRIKKDELVWITSNKSGFSGQRERMKFKDYLENVGFIFNLFGNGFNPINDKFDGLFPFKYSLAIENYSCKDYWTEKLADSFLSLCLPFYWGASNIERYFPKESFIQIDIHKPEKALQIIQKAMLENEWEKRLNAITEARNLVLNEYQFFPYIAEMVKQDYTSNSSHKRVKEYFIPANPFPRSHIVKGQIKYYSRRLLKLMQV